MTRKTLALARVTMRFRILLRAMWKVDFSQMALDASKHPRTIANHAAALDVALAARDEALQGLKRELPIGETAIPGFVLRNDGQEISIVFKVAQ